MTNEEAVEFLDNLMICVKEHPIVADWLIEIENRKTDHCDGCACDDGKHLMYCMNCKGIAWKTEPPKVEDEPQDEILREQCRAFIDIVEHTKGADDERS